MYLLYIIKKYDSSKAQSLENIGGIFRCLILPGVGFMLSEHVWTGLWMIVAGVIISAVLRMFADKIQEEEFMKEEVERIRRAQERKRQLQNEAAQRIQEEIPREITRQPSYLHSGTEIGQAPSSQKVRLPQMIGLSKTVRPPRQSDDVKDAGLSGTLSLTTGDVEEENGKNSVFQLFRGFFACFLTVLIGGAIWIVLTRFINARALSGLIQILVIFASYFAMMHFSASGILKGVQIFLWFVLSLAGAYLSLNIAYSWLLSSDLHLSFGFIFQNLMELRRQIPELDDSYQEAMLGQMVSFGCALIIYVGIARENKGKSNW